MGFPGTVQVGLDAGAWLHPISVQSHLFFLKDLYLAGRPIAVRSSLLEYASAIALLKTGLPEGEESSLFTQLESEIEAILARIDGHLDYFGNPLTWVPMLSFEANLTAFRNEIDRAIPILYLSYWIEKAAEKAEKTRDAIFAAKAKLEQEIDAALDAYEAAQAEVPVLQEEAAQLEVKIAQLTQRLAQLELDLGSRNLFGASEENLRIVDLKAPDPAVRVEGTITGSATLRLTFEHSGHSRILNDGHGYLFTHYITERATPSAGGRSPTASPGAPRRPASALPRSRS